MEGHGAEKHPFMAYLGESGCLQLRVEPGGGGKVPINPEYVQAVHDGIVELRNFEDRAYVYPSGTKMPDVYKV